MNSNTQTPHPHDDGFIRRARALWQTIRPVLIRAMAWFWKQLRQAVYTLWERQQRSFNDNRLYTLHRIRYWFWQLVSKWVYLLLALAACCIAAYVMFHNNPFDRTGYYVHYNEGNPIMGVSFLIIGINLGHHFWVLHKTPQPTED